MLLDRGIFAVEQLHRRFFKPVGSQLGTQLSVVQQPAGDTALRTPPKPAGDTAHCPNSHATNSDCGATSTLHKIDPVILLQLADRFRNNASLDTAY